MKTENGFKVLAVIFRLRFFEPNIDPSPNVKKAFFLQYHGTRKVDFVDEIELWKIGWALVDDRPERLLDTLHSTMTITPRLMPGYIYTTSSVSY
jgi:hypothetical protein